MYGYFQPDKAKLTKEEHKVFDAYYCRICYCLRLLGGQTARFLTSFDVTIYSMILNIAHGGTTPPFFPCQRILKGNMRKFENDHEGLKIAALTLIAIGEKNADDLLDGNSKKAKFLDKLFHKPIEKAKADEQALSEITHAAMDEINRIQDNGLSMDDAFDAYGKMMSELFADFGLTDQRFLDLYYHLARWTFYIDMLCDYAEDYENGTYNGFKTEGLATLKEYFNANYAFLIKKNREMNAALINALMAVQDDSPEWAIVYKIICRALNTVAPALVEGEAVQYNYIRAQKKRFWQEVTRRKKSNFR